jgi:hypothetical protein
LMATPIAAFWVSSAVFRSSTAFSAAGDHLDRHADLNGLVAQIGQLGGRGIQIPLPRRLRSGKRSFKYRAKFTGFPGVAVVRPIRYRITSGR